ncbi:hypothetical protein A4G99_15880 [Haladaptatus sp. R4]|nr:hypothetical protein A4G99_15880 [Haladaptatus sp. R4]
MQHSLQQSQFEFSSLSGFKRQLNDSRCSNKYDWPTNQYDHFLFVDFFTDDLPEFFGFAGSMLGKHSNVFREVLGDSLTHPIDGLIALLV